MKKLGLGALPVALLLGGFSSMVSAESYRLVVVVEPSVYESVSKENLSNALDEQLEYANSVYKETGVSFSYSTVLEWNDSVVSEGLASGKSFKQTVGDIFYSVRYTKEEFDDFFASWAEPHVYNAKANSLLTSEYADKLLFITSEHDLTNGAIGLAFQNMGAVLAVSGLSEPDLVAHELGHTFGLGHPSENVCATLNSVMCQNTSSKVGFSNEEKAIIRGVAEQNADYFLDYFDSRFYGVVADNKPIKGQVNVNVLNNPIENDLTSTEVVIRLVDSAGQDLYLDEPVSMELYTKGLTAVSGVHYESGLFQTVELNAGENTKRLTVKVNHDSKDVQLLVGVRYAENLADSNQETVIIKAKSTTGGNGNNGGDSGEPSGSSGGSFGFAWLALLPLVYYRRQRTM